MYSFEQEKLEKRRKKGSFKNNFSRLGWKCLDCSHYIFTYKRMIILIKLMATVFIFNFIIMGYLHQSMQILALRRDLMRQTTNAHGMTCNLDSCVDYKRCSTDPLLIYIYDKNQGMEGFLRKVPHKEYETAHSKFEEEIAEPLRNGTIEGVHVTRNPSKACLFIVPGLCNYQGNRCDTWEGFIPARLNALPYWNTYGRNHVIFDNEDSELPKYNALDAIIIRTAFHTSFMRHGFDVQMLLHGNVDLRSRWTHLSSQEFLNRPLLISFQGKATHQVRNVIYHHFLKHHEADVKIVLKKRESATISQTENYNDLLLSSRFALVPRGFGTHSYRLMEALSAGCIPIIVSDGYVLPMFDDPYFDWRKFSFKFAESEIDAIVPFLRSLDPKTIIRMHENVKDVYSILERGTHLVNGIPLILNRIRNRRSTKSLT